MQPNENLQGLTVDQVTRLNREYFSSCPADYFDARLWALLRLADVSQDEVLNLIEKPGSLTSRFANMFPGWQFEPDDDPRVRQRAVILEAQALRHHVAETIVRLFKSLVTTRPDESVWFSLASDFETGGLKNWIADHVSSAAASSTVRDKLKVFAFPDFESLANEVGEEVAKERLEVAADWLSFFHWLLSTDGRDIAPAANQIKHGLGILPHDDIKITFVKSLADPTQPTAAELNAGVDIINATSIRYLRRHRPSTKHTWGWDSVLENADAASTLAQVHWGVNLIRCMWVSGRTRFTPELQDADPVPIALWSGPTPREILARSPAVQGGLADHLIRPGRRSS